MSNYQNNYGYQNQNNMNYGGQYYPPNQQGYQQYPQQNQYNNYTYQNYYEEGYDDFLPEEESNGIVIASLVLSILSSLIFFLKDIIPFTVFNVVISRQSFLITSLVFLFFALVSLIVSIGAKLKFKDNPLPMVSLYISGFLTIEAIYILIMFYF